MPRLTMKERFDKFVLKKEIGCWEWQGCKHERGYGYFYTSPSFSQRKMDYAHRVSLFLYKGIKVEEPEVVMHSCDNPSCVNPVHLVVGLQKDNMRDMASKGRAKGRGRLTALDTELAILMREEGATLKTISEFFKISKSHASRVSRGLIKTYSEG